MKLKSKGKAKNQIIELFSDRSYLVQSDGEVVIVSLPPRSSLNETPLLTRRLENGAVVIRGREG